MSDRSIDEYLRRYELATVIPPAMRRALRVETVPPFTTIYVEGERPHALYFLVDGTVQCIHYHANGTPTLVAISRPLTLLGDVELFGDHETRSHVFTTGTTTLLRVSMEVAEQAGRDHAPFLRFAFDQLRAKLLYTNELWVARTLPVLSRLALFIRSRADRDGCAELPSKEIMAGLLSTSRRHLNRVFRALVVRGAIDATYPRVRVVDRTLLEQIADDAP